MKATLEPIYMKATLMIGIYKITSPSGRVYIGQSVDIENRWTHYRSLDCRDMPKLYASLSKYGHEAHCFELVEECDISNLSERERYWQEYYNVVEEVLNCKLVSTKDKSGYTSEETKQKISVANRGKVSGMKGKTHSEETKHKMSESQRKIPRAGRPIGSTHTEGTKRKISKAKKGKPAKNRREILQVGKQGEILRKWNSITEAQRELGITGVGNVLTGRCETAGGYIWKYKNK